MPANLLFDNDYIAGNCFVVGDDFQNEGFKSPTVDEIRTARKDLINRSVEYENIKEQDFDMEEE